MSHLKIKSWGHFRLNRKYGKASKYVKKFKLYGFSIVFGTETETFETLGTLVSVAVSVSIRKSRSRSRFNFLVSVSVSVLVSVPRPRSRLGLVNP